MKANKLITIFVLLSSICFSHSALSISSTDVDTEKMAIAKQVWEPIFSTINFETEGSRLPFTQEIFLKTNKLFYEAYSEFLTKPELLLMQRMFATSVGNRIAINMMRTQYGLQPFRFSYDDFSAMEKEEWEKYSRDNHKQQKLLEHKMNGFAPFIQSKLAK